MTEKVYELSYDLGRFEDVEEDLVQDGHLENKFDGWYDLKSAFPDCIPITVGSTKGGVTRERREDLHWHTVEAFIPGEISFLGLRDWLTPTDFPYIDYGNWPIMSKRMVEVLLSVGDFPHQIIPVIFKSEDEVLWGEFIDGPPPTTNHDYVLLNLLELSDLFDKERSTCTLEPSNINPEVVFITNIGDVVLKEPAEGFPPIFRVKGDEIPLYVSAKAKEVLEAANIQGLSFSVRRWS
jgi:hypothetical protein